MATTNGKKTTVVNSSKPKVPPVKGATGRVPTNPNKPAPQPNSRSAAKGR